jgi:hypothetical protein
MVPFILIGPTSIEAHYEESSQVQEQPYDSIWKRCSEFKTSFVIFNASHVMTSSLAKGYDPLYSSK